jgi:hypothetical protein
MRALLLLLLLLHRLPAGVVALPAAAFLGGEELCRIRLQHSVCNQDTDNH